MVEFQLVCPGQLYSQTEVDNITFESKNPQYSNLILLTTDSKRIASPPWAAPGFLS